MSFYDRLKFNADGLIPASIFHVDGFTVGDVKKLLAGKKILVRL